MKKAINANHYERINMENVYKTKNYLDPILVLEFDIEADKEQVYKAWTDIELFKQWFCPAGFSIALSEMTAEAGGYFRIHMQSPDGVIYPTKGEYILLEKPNRIVYKDSWDDDRESNEPAIAEIQFESVGGKTKIKLYSSFANEKLKEETLASGVADGWKMFLNNLTTLLKKI